MKKILLPFFLFLAFAFLINYLVPEWRENVNLNSLKIALTYCNPFFLRGCGVFWFFIVLFETRIIFYVLYKPVFKKANNIVMLFSALLWVYLTIKFNELQDSLHYYVNHGVGLAFWAMPFFLIGYWLRDDFKKLGLHKKTFSSIFVMLICFILIIFFSIKDDRNVNFGMGAYDNLFYYLLFALAGSFAVILVSPFLQKSKFLKFCGKESLTIMLFHCITADLVRYFLEKKGISIDDKTINIGSVLLFLCALTVPIILALLKNTVKVKIKKTKTSTQKEVLVQDEIDKMLNS